MERKDIFGSLASAMVIAGIVILALKGFSVLHLGEVSMVVVVVGAIGFVVLGTIFLIPLMILGAFVKDVLTDIVFWRPKK